VLYHVVNERHLKRRPMNLHDQQVPRLMGQGLHDEALAAAIVDRILERGRVLKLDGPTIRTKDLGLDDSTGEASKVLLKSHGGRKENANTCSRA
jgi:DNA replication protein DnaC